MENGNKSQAGGSSGILCGVGRRKQADSRCLLRVHLCHEDINKVTSELRKQQQSVACSQVADISGMSAVRDSYGLECAVHLRVPKAGNKRADDDQIVVFPC